MVTMIQILALLLLASCGPKQEEELHDIDQMVQVEEFKDDSRVRS